MAMAHLDLSSSKDHVHARLGRNTTAAAILFTVVLYLTKVVQYRYYDLKGLDNLSRLK